MTRRPRAAARRERRPASRGGPGGRYRGFDIFAVHQRLIRDYRDFTEGAAVIRDDRIAKSVDAGPGRQVPVARPVAVAEPVLRRRRIGRRTGRRRTCCTRSARASSSRQDRPGTTCDGRPIRLTVTSEEAIRVARGGDNYVLTTGTGSGKSLAYIVPIVDHVLRARQGRPAGRSRPSSSTR